MGRKIFPLNINGRVRVSGGRGRVNNRCLDLKEGGYYEDHSKDRVTVSLAEKLETMGTGAKLNGSGGVDKVNKRLIEMVVSILSLGVVEG